jgi:hypothetical protein
VSTVTLRNSTRTALRFRVPAQSVYLRPGDTFDLPEAHLGSEEVKLLLRDGALLHVTPPKPSAATAATPPSTSPPAAEEDLSPSDVTTSGAPAKAASVAPEGSETRSPREGKGGRSK